MGLRCPPPPTRPLCLPPPSVPLAGTPGLFLLVFPRQPHGRGRHSASPRSQVRRRPQSKRSACRESGQVRVGLQGRVHLACPCVLWSGLSPWRGAPCGLPRAQGHTDRRSSGAETLVSTGAAGQRSSTADPPSCHGGPAGPAANAGGAWPWARPAALAGQAPGDWGPAREGDSLCHLALSCSPALASAVPLPAALGLPP